MHRKGNFLSLQFYPTLRCFPTSIAPPFPLRKEQSFQGYQTEQDALALDTIHHIKAEWGNPLR